MIKTDTIQHYVNMSGIRMTIADISSAAATAQEIHRLPALSATILSKILAGTSVLATDFKNHEGISIHWNTNSELGVIHADAYEGKFIRGYIDHHDVDLAVTLNNEKILVSADAQLTITRYSLLRTPYNSRIHLSFGSIDECFSQYLAQSDQTTSFIFVASKLSSEGKIIRSIGLLAQLLPDGDIEKFNKYFKSNDPLFTLDGLCKGEDLQKFIRMREFSLIKESSISFRCTCSEERIKTALLTLPRSEQNSLLNEDHIEIACHYCGEVREIGREKLQQWFQEKGGDIQ